MYNRVALGTVQFGLPYGISNQSGQVSRTEVAAVLEHAWSAGLNTVDTAISYGESEQRLGDIGVGRWQVISKLPAIPEPCHDVAGWVKKSVEGSLSRLKIDCLKGLLLHHPKQLLGPYGEKLYKSLLGFKKRGIVQKIGVSIYAPEDLDALWPHFRFDLIQAPFNVLDRRLQTSGWLARLHQSGVTVHVRSIFLQGLLLMEADRRPEKFHRWKSLWDEWHDWLDTQTLTPVKACLGFALSDPKVDRVVVGVDNLKQLKEILMLSATPVKKPPRALATEDPDLINPFRWSCL